MKNQPLITVGVTTYNRQDLLKECISSILSQRYSNIEIIIGNDFVDELVTFESLGLAPDLRVKIVNHPSNIGAYANNHFLLREAKGDWFTWLADDDLMHPEFLNSCYAVFSKHNVNSVFSNYLAKSDPQGDFPKKLKVVEPIIYPGGKFIDEYTHRRLRTVGCYGVFRRELFDEISNVPRFGTGLPVYGDTFIPILAASLGNVAYIDFELIFLRTHAGSRSVSEDEITVYSSAQSDFLSEFEKRWGGLNSKNTYENQIESLLRWFVSDALAIVARKFQSIKSQHSIFYKYLINTIWPWLPDRLKVPFIFYVVKLVLVENARVLLSRVIRRLKSWL